MEKYIEETKMLDFSHKSIQALIISRDWRNLNEFGRIKAIYNFVRDEIKFGYNVSDKISASKVLKDGYGQCNTKGTLFMALLRSVGIPCRVHGFTIDKELQKGAMTGIVYRNAPENVFHSWVEVCYQDKWYNLEAFILDKDYLTKLQNKFYDCQALRVWGLRIRISETRNRVNANDTYIQSEGINQDFGVYDNPDELLKEHGQEMSKCKEIMYRLIGRRLMNRNVKKIRNLK